MDVVGKHADHGVDLGVRERESELANVLPLRAPIVREQDAVGRRQHEFLRISSAFEQSLGTGKAAVRVGARGERRPRTRKRAGARTFRVGIISYLQSLASPVRRGFDEVVGARHELPREVSVRAFGREKARRQMVEKRRAAVGSNHRVRDRRCRDRSVRRARDRRVDDRKRQRLPEAVRRRPKRDRESSRTNATRSRGAARSVSRARRSFFGDSAPSKHAKLADDVREEHRRVTLGIEACSKALRIGEQQILDLEAKPGSRFERRPAQSERKQTPRDGVRLEAEDFFESLEEERLKTVARARPDEDEPPFGRLPGIEPFREREAEVVPERLRVAKAACVVAKAARRVQPGGAHGSEVGPRVKCRQRPPTRRSCGKKRALYRMRSQSSMKSPR